MVCLLTGFLYWFTCLQDCSRSTDGCISVRCIITNFTGTATIGIIGYIDERFFAVSDSVKCEPINVIYYYRYRTRQPHLI